LMSTRTFCTLTFQRRLVALIEWLRLLPKPGVLPHTAQIRDIVLSLLVGGAPNSSVGYRLQAAPKRPPAGDAIVCTVGPALARVPQAGSERRFGSLGDVVYNTSGTLP